MSDRIFSQNMDVAPTYANRINLLDFLRGFAILGILIANIPAFSTAFFAKEVMMQMGGGTYVPSLHNALVEMFVSGKFRGLLAMLFGAGLYLQYLKLSAAGRWPKGYLKRTAILAGIGIVHAIFIWLGDILFTYSLVAFVGMWCVKLEDKKLAWIIAGCGAMAFLIAAGSTALMAFMSVSDSEVTKATAQGSASSFETWFSIETETRIYATGSYWEQTLHRLVVFFIMASSFIAMLPTLLGQFLFGIWLMRSGFLSRPASHPVLGRRLLLVGAIGLILNAIPMLAWLTGSQIPTQIATELLFSPALAVGYLAIMTIFFQVVPGALTRPIVNIGRTALSCYLLQSLICTFVFYSWGLGQFGNPPLSQQYGVVFAVWAANLAFANLWLWKLDIGPVEWVWRSLTIGRRVPWKKMAVTEAAPPAMPG